MNNMNARSPSYAGVVCLSTSVLCGYIIFLHADFAIVKSYREFFLVELS